MKTSEAWKLVGGLSKPGKMPGWSIGIPAKECKTGSKLRAVKGSVCEDCYAGCRHWFRVDGRHTRPRSCYWLSVPFFIFLDFVFTATSVLPLAPFWKGWGTLCIYENVLRFSVEQRAIQLLKFDPLDGHLGSTDINKSKWLVRMSPPCVSRFKLWEAQKNWEPNSTDPQLTC